MKEELQRRLASLAHESFDATGSSSRGMSLSQSRISEIIRLHGASSSMKRASPGSESVKFDNSLVGSDSDSECELEPTTALPKDETLRLFSCLPKGLEYFLQSGPPKLVVDYMDYEKICSAEAKERQYKKDAPREELPNDHRKIDIGEKEVELQIYLQIFEPYVAEYKRKYDRASVSFAHCRAVNTELTSDIIRLHTQIRVMQKRKDKLIDQVIKYEKMDSFLEALLKCSDTGFTDYGSIMDKHSTLLSTNLYLRQKFTNRYNVEQKLNEELQKERDLGKQRELNCRKKIVSGKKQVDNLIASNFAMEQECLTWSKTTAEKWKDNYDLTMAILNMAKSVMKERPFTERLLGHVTSPFACMEAIGILLKDYIQIAKEYNAMVIRRNKKLTPKLTTSVDFKLKPSVKQRKPSLRYEGDEENNDDDEDEDGGGDDDGGDDGGDGDK